MARILIIDDDKDLATMVEEWLSNEKHYVTITHNGTDGLKALQQDPYDLVILDWDMPDLSGIDLLQKYRTDGGTTPVMMLSGRKTEDEKIVGLDLGATDYLTKPFSLKELSARIRSTLRQHQPVSQTPKSLGTNNEELLNRANLAGTALAARYEFIELIGQGAAGIVFKARNPSLEKFVAVKMMLMSGLKNEALARFEQEAKLIGRLDHPGIAAIYDFGVTERFQSYMIMEYVEGRTLSDCLKQYFNLPVRMSLFLTSKICESIGHAHSKGIIHRDLKPSNVMVKETPGVPPSIKLLDFGCGKFRDLSSEQGVELTQEGTTLGSPPYMSPEQVRGKAADERSDIYSLGCVIYEMLTGYPPFMGNNPNEIMLKHLEEPVKALKDTRPDANFPAALDTMVAKTLDKNPVNRYQSIPELLEALKKLGMEK